MSKIILFSIDVSEWCWQRYVSKVVVVLMISASWLWTQMLIVVAMLVVMVAMVAMLVVLVAMVAMVVCPVSSVQVAAVAGTRPHIPHYHGHTVPQYHSTTVLQDHRVKTWSSLDILVSLAVSIGC